MGHTGGDRRARHIRCLTVHDVVLRRRRHHRWVPAVYLLANPGEATATVDVDSLKATGSVVTRRYEVAPGHRLTVWVNQEADGLGSAEVATRIRSSQPIVAERTMHQEGATLTDTAFSTRVESDVAIVAERAMWWRAPSSSGWIEGHTEVGATAGSTRWAIAEMPESAFLPVYLSTPVP